ncbi:MAG: 5'-nucleotidase C-terminal domain-containing protein [Bacteroidales bacterium]
MNLLNLRHTILMVCLLLIALSTGYAAENRTNKEKKTLTILFTNDIHSSANPRALPYQPALVNGSDTLRLVGGFARLSTLVKQEKAIGEKNHSAVILVDAGDVAMGTLFHSVYQSEAFELRTLARLGYDAYTFGNHDFDYGAEGVGKMLLSAYRSKDTASYKFPYVLAANIKPYNQSMLEAGYRAAGVKNSVIIERNGLKIGLIGLLGEEAYSVIGEKDHLQYLPFIETAKKEAALLKQQGADFIVAISHGGTLSKGGDSKTKKKSPDGILAQQVPALDAIISGHDHESLYKPLIINKTVIGSVGACNVLLGKMVLTKDSLLSYNLLPITKDVAVDTAIRSWIHSIEHKISLTFNADLGVSPFDTITVLERDYTTDTDPDGNLELGGLIARSYKEAALNYVGNLNRDELIAVIPFGVIRNTLAKGSVTYNDVFNVLSLGKGSGGKIGYPLVLAWLNGKELKDVCEMVATVAPGMGDARLFFDGLTFSYNSYKLPFTKVTGVKVNGVPVNNKKLYPVVTGMYTAKLIGLLKKESYGILSAQPKDKEGNLITDFNKIVIKKLNKPVTEKADSIHTMDMSEWLAFAEYLQKGGGNAPVDKSAVNKTNPLAYLLYLAELTVLGILIAGLRKLWKKFR